MQAVDLVRDALGRVHEVIPAVLDGLERGDLLWRPDAEANPIGWLIWHLTRIEDGHMAQLGGLEQVWIAGGWHQAFGLPYLKSVNGFGMTPPEVGLFNVQDATNLNGYAAAVWAQSQQVLADITEDDLHRIIDPRYTPPVTVGVRLVSVVAETAQHVGQAGYLRGMRERTLGVSSGWAGTA